MRRDAHPKHHACLHSSLQIDPSRLPVTEQVGLYARPATYNAWIRFSNADPSGDAKPDLDVDQRGMTLKILGVPGSPNGNHDLVMMDSEAFPSKNYLRERLEPRDLNPCVGMTAGLCTGKTKYLIRRRL